MQLRLTALAEGVDLGAELVFHGGAAEAEAMFLRHVIRWLPHAVCWAGASDDHATWRAGVARVDAVRGEFAVSAAAVVFRALVQHSKVTPIDGRPPMEFEFFLKFTR